MRLLAAAALASLAAAAPAAAAATTVHVYFLRGDHGAVVHRGAPPGAAAQAAVLALLRGPTPAERAHGLTSCVPAGTRLLGLGVRHGVAAVDLSRRFESGGGVLSNAARLGQLVYTLTALPDVRSVYLLLDGRPVRVFGGEGPTLRQPLTRSSFAGYLP